MAVVSTLVASGAYYAYKGKNLFEFGGDQEHLAAQYLAPGQSAGPGPRKALVIDRGQLFTGTISGDEPLQKETDGHGRKVLEMMSPDQVTKKLRDSEESWLVNRGNGVVRYDVVQLPSNDPIEDDHAEKTVEVSRSATDASGGSDPSDWMFWGVFDGHRQVYWREKFDTIR